MGLLVVPKEWQFKVRNLPMSMIFYLKNRLRSYIFPAGDLIPLLCGSMPKRPVNILDVGSGSGWFLRMVLEHTPNGSRGIGVEVDSRHFHTQELPNGNHLRILGPEDLDCGYAFDFMLFNDVLHHVQDKKSFLTDYLQKLSPGGYVFIKDMSPEHFLCSRWNRLHDKIVSGDSIREISLQEIMTFFSRDFECLCYGGKRIFLYDHYWCVFRERGLSEKR